VVRRTTRVWPSSSSPRIGEVDRHGVVLVDPATSVTRTSGSWTRVIHKIIPSRPDANHSTSPVAAATARHGPAKFSAYQPPGEASLAAHLILSVIGIWATLGSMVFSAVAFGGWFRLYSLIALTTVVTFIGLALSYAPAVNAGQPHPSLARCTAFGAYFLSLSCLRRSCA
jgi:hypothetical protein